MTEVIIYCTPMKKYSKVGNFKFSLNGSAMLYTLEEVRKEIADARKNGFHIEFR